MIHIGFNLNDEHTAMLDAIEVHAKTGSRTKLIKSLLIAVLEDDAATHGAAVHPNAKVVVISDWRNRK